ncbi:transglutaminase-like cysteine peptidase [Pseudomonas sp. A3.4]|nr:transglutaminase-like cysteine peptidase [Atopomonas sediminilitoris]MCJ8168814.1 transglutaminase-like cysteine peptidase [Atopomonas sediminilitoris]
MRLRPLSWHLPATLAAWLLAAALLVAKPASAPWDFSLILRQAQSLYPNHSAAGLRRLEAWQSFIERSQALSEDAKLDAVNRFFNDYLLFANDSQIWGQVDYWASPVESLLRGEADCEDYSLAKYFTLRQLGVPSERLRITYVKALELNQAHMVLTYYADGAREPLVLDNLIPSIRPASARRDLLPVYAFNAEGVWLPGPAGGRRTGDSKKLARWQDLQDKMQREGFPPE